MWYAANCVVEATQFQTVCASFITALNSATGGQVIATTDSQIQALVAQMAAKQETPSAQCCTAAISLFSDVSLPIKVHQSIRSQFGAVQVSPTAQFKTVLVRSLLGSMANHVLTSFLFCCRHVHAMLTCRL